MGVGGPKLPVQVFTSVTKQNKSTPGSPRILGLSPCVVLPNLKGTNLLWDDMKRTLTFAWELHVFGSASLFILMAVLAGMGMAGAQTLPRPICDTLTLANSLLVLGGTLRGIILLLDPYGTHQILSHAALAALHNVPLQALLWAQVTLTLVTLRRLNILPFWLKLQHPWVVGGLAILHCTSLLVADLFTTALVPTLPLLLQTISVCWGLPLCMGIMPKSCSHLHPFLGSFVPQWAPSQRIEKCAKRVTAACAFLGVLCCSLQIYTVLWLYGLLGNWRQFGWGWWLSQFWARIFELSWGFSLLVLGSWIFWMTSKGHLRNDGGQSISEVSKKVEEKSLWSKILARIQTEQLRKSEQTWEDLMPNKWAKYKLSKSWLTNNIQCPYDYQPSTTVLHYETDPVSNSSSESQATLLWQKVRNHECVLSLIEFDMRPPSPINLYRGHLVPRVIFSPPPPSWSHSMGRDTTDGAASTTTYPSTYIGYGWTLDTEPVSACLNHFPVTEPIQIPRANSVYNSRQGSRAIPHQGVTHQLDWFDDDVTDL